MKDLLASHFGGTRRIPQQILHTTCWVSTSRTGTDASDLAYTRRPSYVLTKTDGVTTIDRLSQKFTDAIPVHPSVPAEVALIGGLAKSNLRKHRILFVTSNTIDEGSPTMLRSTKRSRFLASWVRTLFPATDPKEMSPVCQTLTGEPKDYTP